MNECCEVCQQRIKSLIFPSVFSPSTRDGCHFCVGIFCKPTNVLDPLCNLISLSQSYSTSSFTVHFLPSPTLKFLDSLLEKSELSPKISAFKDAFRSVYAPLLAQKLGKTFNPSSPLSLNIQVITKEADLFVAEIIGKQVKNKKRRFRNINSHNVNPFSEQIISINEITEFINQLTPKDALSLLQHEWNNFPFSLSYTLCHDPLYLFGFYSKLIRNIPHTPFADYETSLSCISMNPFNSFFDSSSYRFESSGREDTDVRCLGRRPFCTTFYDPKRIVLDCSLLDTVNQSIPNDLVLLSNLKVSLDGKYFRDFVKKGETSKSKKYRCVIHTDQAVDYSILESLVGRAIELAQKTPLRVVHRRALLTRTRSVMISSFERLNDYWFVLDLVTDAGTYVKEFVHSDLGRTKPSLCSLLAVSCEIAQLDVVDIVLE
ncbi:hypothetical protein RCL1_008309 [Eukaryota sp. TZLM3-RCL]